MVIILEHCKCRNEALASSGVSCSCYLGSSVGLLLISFVYQRTNKQLSGLYTWQDKLVAVSGCVKQINNNKKLFQASLCGVIYERCKITLLPQCGIRQMMLNNKMNKECLFGKKSTLCSSNRILVGRENVWMLRRDYRGTRVSQDVTLFRTARRGSSSVWEWGCDPASP